MYLKEVSLKNWRKFKSIDEEAPALVVPFKKGLNILIGENDSGKTAIIDAIRMVLGTNSKNTEWITDEDFSEGTESLEVECIFDNLSSKEEAFFLEWLTLEGEQLEKSSLRIVLRAIKYKDANDFVSNGERFFFNFFRIYIITSLEMYSVKCIKQNFILTCLLNLPLLPVILFVNFENQDLCWSPCAR